MHERRQALDTAEGDSEPLQETTEANGAVCDSELAYA